MIGWEQRRTQQTEEIGLPPDSDVANELRQMSQMESVINWYKAHKNEKGAEYELP